jgi:O-antigen ligase
MRDTWRELGGGLAATYARSTWRLPVLFLGGGLLFLLPLYLLRGVRLVEIAVLAILALVAAAVGFTRPFQTLCLGLFMIFSGVGRYLPAAGFLVTGLVLVSVARGICDILDRGPADLGTRSFGLSLGTLLAASLTSLLVAHNFKMAAGEAWHITFGLLLYFALSRFADSPQRILAAVIAVSAGLGVGTLVVLRGLLTVGGLQLLALASEARFGGIGGDPNLQACYANCCVATLVYAMGYARRWARVGLAVLLLLLVATVVLSQSRAGMLLLGLVLLVVLLGQRRSRQYAFLGIAVLAVVALTLPRVYWVRFESIGQLGGIVVDRSLQLRQHALEGGWGLFLEHPWFGVGLGNFSDRSPHFMLGHFLAHNTFVEVAATIGLIGGLAYIGLLASGWYMTRQAAVLWGRAGKPADRATAHAIGISIVVFALSGLSLSIPFYFIVWVVLGLANAARRSAERSAGEAARA